MPGEAGEQIGCEIARPMAVDDGEMHETLGQARKEHRDPIDRRLEQDRLEEGARSKRVMTGSALAVSTALPTTSAAKVASIKLLTAAA